MVTSSLTSSVSTLSCYEDDSCNHLSLQDDIVTYYSIPFRKFLSLRDIDCRTISQEACQRKSYPE